MSMRNYRKNNFTDSLSKTQLENTAMVSVPFMAVPELRKRQMATHFVLGSAPHLPTMECLPPF